MGMDITKRLSKSDRLRYQAMLDTNYVLVRCDECALWEEDVNGQGGLSVSWIHSIKPGLEAFGIPLTYYPEGSVTSNLMHYQAIRNYHGGQFLDNPDQSFLRQGLVNFIRLRRDDSAVNRSYLFGSTYRIASSANARNPRHYRIIDVSIRHSAGALWILLQESGSRVPTTIQQSLKALHSICQLYFKRREEWTKDYVRHFTISAIIQACQAALTKDLPKDLGRKLTRLMAVSEQCLLSDACISKDAGGSYFFSAPPEDDSWMYRFEYYMSGCALRLVPHLIKCDELQQVIRTMISNRVDSRIGCGIPLKRGTGYKPNEKPVPDFGVTASVLYVMWYSLENLVGGREWQRFCDDNFDWAMSFCLNSYDKAEYYSLIMNENNAQILLMPGLSNGSSSVGPVQDLIVDIKGAIESEMKTGKGKLDRALDRIVTPDHLEHVPGLIKRWQIDKSWTEPSKWEFVGQLEKDKLTIPYGTIGELLGGVLKVVTN